MLQRIKLDPQVSAADHPWATLYCGFRSQADWRRPPRGGHRSTVSRIGKKGCLRGGQVRRLLGERAHFCISVRPLAIVWRESPALHFLISTAPRVLFGLHPGRE